MGSRLNKHEVKIEGPSILKEGPLMFIADSQGKPLLEVKEDGFYMKGLKIKNNDSDYLKFYRAFETWVHLNSLK